MGSCTSKHGRAVLESFRPDRAEGLGANIADYLRDLIRSETLAAGERIPPTEQLSSWWGVNGRTVHAALSPLVKEGLVVRKPRCGTFVCEPGAGLRNVAVYDVRGVHDAAESAYIRVVQSVVQEVLAQEGMFAQVWMDTRTQQEEPWAELVAACRERKVDAVLAVYAGDAVEWMEKLPVPVTLLFVERPMGPSVVETDLSQQYELALGELARQGGRSVGLISCAVAETWRRPPVKRAYDRLFDVAAQLGLEIREGWLPVSGRSTRGTAQSHEEYGYRQFKELWALEERPEGLFVDDDVVSRGVVQAILEVGVRVPEELKLVLYRNVETAAFCPVPAAFVEISLADVGRAAVEQVRGQLRGERGARVLLPARLCQNGRGMTPGKMSAPAEESLA